MKHVLVTGGAGFVGSHLVDSLLARGYAVTALDSLLTGRKENVRQAMSSPHFEYIEQDVCDPIDLTKWSLLQKHGLSGVFHFACPASPIDFDLIPFEILNVDSVGTALTVELALKYDARYMVASTSEIYGDPLEHPQKETYYGNVSTTGPRACYDETKRFAEAYVSTAIRGVGKRGGKTYKPLNAAIVRIFNTYGPRMRPDDGRIVPELCMQALNGKPMTIHGTGQQTRSFCYVSDLVEGIIRLFESDLKEPCNIGNPVERSVRDFAEVVEKITETRVGIQSLPAREDDPRRRCPDITKARTRLGWEPKVSLEEGLKATVEYFKTQLTQ
jgi:dTDP-glucose 4,6-dehydratase